MCEIIPRIPLKVRRALKNAGCSKIEWEHFSEEKWFGYCDFGVLKQRIALTVALVTGKAIVELLAPLFEDEVLL